MYLKILRSIFLQLGCWDGEKANKLRMVKNFSVSLSFESWKVVVPIYITVNKAEELVNWGFMSWG